MKLFISWSGEKSKKVASVLREWIPDIIQAVEPWMSQTDIAAGARWNREIDGQLSETRFGIVCLTRTNLNAPWILFEVGALAKTITDTFVCPYLIGLEPSQIPQGPLTQFQAKRANKEETWELICAINKALKDDTLPDEKLKRAFDRWWPKLKKALDSLQVEESPEEAQSANRSADFDKFLALGIETIRDRLTDENLQKHLARSKHIKVLKTWFPESMQIAEGLEEAIIQGAKVELLLCKPGSEILLQRSRGADREDWWGSFMVYHAVGIVYKCLLIKPDADVQIALYNSWPGCPVIWYDKTILIGFYMRGRSSPSWPWLSLRDGMYFARILDKQFEKLWHDPTTKHMNTLKQIKKWLKENKQWAELGVVPKQSTES